MVVLSREIALEEQGLGVEGNLEVRCGYRRGGGVGRGDFRRTCRTGLKGIQEGGLWAAGAEFSGDKEQQEQSGSVGNCPKGAGRGERGERAPSRDWESKDWEFRGDRGCMYRVPVNGGEGLEGWWAWELRPPFLGPGLSFI